MNLFQNILNKSTQFGQNFSLQGVAKLGQKAEDKFKLSEKAFNYAQPEAIDPIQRYLYDPEKSNEGKQNLMDNLKAGIPKEVLQSYITENVYKPKEFSQMYGSTAPTFQYNPEDNPITTAGKFLGNIPSSGLNLVQQTMNLGRTVQEQGFGETANMIGRGIVRGIGEGAQTVQTGYNEGGTLGALNTSLQGVNKYLTQNPAEILAPSSIKPMGNIIKSGGKTIMQGAEAVAPKVTNAIIKTPQALGKGVTTGAEYTTSLATGLSREAQQTIKSSPKLYKEARLGNITAQSELENFVKATDARLADLSELGKGYESIKVGNKVASVDDITNSYVKATEGVRDTQLTKADRLVLKDANDYMSQLKGELDETDVLGLRRQLDSIMYDPNTGLKRKISPTGERIVNSMRAEIDKIAKERIPGLKELDAQYGPEVALLKDVKKQIYDANGNIKPTALSTISNIVGKNKDFKLEQFQKIYPELGARIKALKAFEEVQSLGEIKTGSVIRQGGAIATGSALAPGVGTVIGWMATNPYVVARVLELYGIAKSKISEILRKGAKISTKEAEIVVKAVKSTPKEKMADIINNLSFDPKTNRLTSGTLGPKKLNTMGKMENAKTPKSIVAQEKGSIVSPQVKPVEKTVKPLTPKKQSATMGNMETRKLIEEARKYKSKDDFIDSYGEEVYRGSANAGKITELKPTYGMGGYFGDGLYLSRDFKTASKFANKETMNPTYERNGDGSYTDINTGKKIDAGSPGVLSVIIPKNLKLKKLTEEQFSDEFETYRAKDGSIDMNKTRNIIAKKYEDMGYDGFEIPRTPVYFEEPQTVIFPKSVYKIKLRSQLEKIYEQAKSPQKTVKPKK